MSPRVSVVLPVYNAMPYLDEAMASVLGQSLEDFELIAINDGSTDGSAACLRSWAERDGRVRLVDRENRGLVATLNEGIGLARAALIARMDGDDVCEPLRLERQVEYLEGHPEVVACGSQAVIIDERGWSYSLSRFPQEHEALEAALLKGQCLVLHPSVMMRTGVVRGLGGYRAGLAEGERVDLCEDLDLWLRITERHRMVNLEQRLIRYRKHTGSITSRLKAAQHACSVRVLREACEARGLDAGPVIAGMSALETRVLTPDRLAAEAFRAGFGGVGWRYVWMGLWGGPRWASAKQAVVRVLGRRVCQALGRYKARLLGRGADGQGAGC
ncbi:MAG: glycosyltransferase family 2 protein [Planctomycetota bacterium]